MKCALGVLLILLGSVTWVVSRAYDYRHTQSDVSLPSSLPPLVIRALTQQGAVLGPIEVTDGAELDLCLAVGSIESLDGEFVIDYAEVESEVKRRVISDRKSEKTWEGHRRVDRNEKAWPSVTVGFRECVPDVKAALHTYVPVTVRMNVRYPSRTGLSSYKVEQKRLERKIRLYIVSAEEMRSIRAYGHDAELRQIRWVFVALCGVTMFVVGIVMVFKAPPVTWTRIIPEYWRPLTSLAAVIAIFLFIILLIRLHNELVK